MKGDPLNFPPLSLPRLPFAPLMSHSFLSLLFFHSPLNLARTSGLATVPASCKTWRGPNTPGPYDLKVGGDAVCTHAQTDGQPENIMPPDPSVFRSAVA